MAAFEMTLSDLVKQNTASAATKTVAQSNEIINTDFLKQLSEIIKQVNELLAYFGTDVTTLLKQFAGKTNAGTAGSEWNEWNKTDVKQAPQSNDPDFFFQETDKNEIYEGRPIKPHKKPIDPTKISDAEFTVNEVKEMKNPLVTMILPKLKAAINQVPAQYDTLTIADLKELAKKDDPFFIELVETMVKEVKL